MFTGLIQDVGRISQLIVGKSQAEIVISTALKSIKLGESIAVNGACLSVTAFKPESFCVFASKETLEKTGLGALKPNDMVNLERALCVGDPLGGHIVTGHIDTQVRLQSRIAQGDSQKFTLSLPDDKSVCVQIAPKGSVTLNGVSLTINHVNTHSFEVMIIPVTLQHTTFADNTTIKPGTKINLETDVLAKYVGAMLDRKTARSESVSMDLLIRNGFMR